MPRVRELDAIRGLAAILIIFFHFSYPSPFYDRVAYAFGPIAMELFFVLSGFLITAIILENGDRKGFLSSFYIRRGLRIWPIYYLLLAAYVALLVLRPRMGNLSTWPLYVSYTQNLPLIWGRDIPTLAYPLMPTWSLAVEEQFYFLWPGMVLATGVGNYRRVAVVMVVVAVASMAARGLGIHEMTLPGRCDGFALGGLLAVLCKAVPQRTNLRIFSAAIIASLLFQGVGSWAGHTRFWNDVALGSRGFTVRATSILAFGVVGLVVACSGARILAPLRTRWLGHIGRISYGLYLYHLTALMIAIAVLARLSPGAGQLSVSLVAGVVVLGMAAVSYRLVELPFLRLKNRFGYRHEQAPSSSDLSETLAGRTA